MTTEFLMPGLSETSATGIVLKWLVKPGTKVDKAIVELESPCAGRVLSTGVQEGEAVEAGRILAVIATSGEVDGAPVVATLAMAHLALRVANEMAADGISVEVIDPRTLVPFDKETLLNSVAKTNRLVVATERPKTGGVSAELAGVVVEEGFDLLEAPILRVTSLATPVPLAANAEVYVLPSESHLHQAILNVLGEAEPLEGS
jgi:pyruvate/2-oxoglutarate/acetoin dehydrogenase E1 component